MFVLRILIVSGRPFLPLGPLPRWSRGGILAPVRATHRRINEVRIRCRARIDREQCRSSAPCDLRERHRQDETRRAVDLCHSSDGPSWIDLAEIHVSTTESRFTTLLNLLLQQNRRKAGSRQTQQHEQVGEIQMPRWRAHYGLAAGRRASSFRSSPASSNTVPCGSCSVVMYGASRSI